MRIRFEHALYNKKNSILFKNTSADEFSGYH